MAEAAALIIGPSIALGLIIGIYEALVIRRDVQIASHKMGHSLHAIILSIAFVFGTMNAQFVLNLIPQLQAIPVLGSALGVHIILGLIAAIKIHAVSLAFPGMSSGSATGMGETWFHSILIGALIVAAPYAYPLVEPMIPSLFKF